MSNFIVYKASAGSGKTFSLVIEYLCIALENDYGIKYRKILGVTFTNKAAGELKERILDYLKGVSIEETDPKYQKFVAEILCERLSISKEKLRYRAQKTLTDILHHYSSLSISTIDKFVHRLMRSFAKELNLQVDFNLELDPTEMHLEVAQGLINQFGQDPSTTAWVMNWLISSLKEGKKNSSYENQLANFLGEISTDDSFLNTLDQKPLGAEELDLVLIKAKKIINAFDSLMMEYGERGCKIIKESGLNIADFAHNTTSGAGLFYKLRDGQLVDYGIGPRMAGQFEKQTLFAAKSPHKNQIEAITPALTEVYRAVTTHLETFLTTYQWAKTLAKELYLKGLAAKLEALLIEYKSTKNVVLLADFNKRIAEIVVNEPAPFIYELLGERYDHFLIDEFQDTSILQWQNFLPLIDNGLSKGHKSLLVGDGKQSIYRFRGGEVEQFKSLPAIYKSPGTSAFKQFELSLARNHKPITIKENYRSSIEVVHFNNGFIQSLSNYLADDNIGVFADGEQLPKRTEEGYVTVKQFTKPSKIKESSYDEEDEDEAMDMIELQLQSLLVDLRKLEGFGFPFSSSCVLINSNYDGTVIAKFLLNNGIPVISEESLTVLYSPKTRLLLGCFQLLDDPKNVYGQVNAIENALLLGLLQGDYLALFNKYTVNQYGNKVCLVDTLFSDLGLELTSKQLQQLDLYTLAELLANRFGFMNDADPFIQFFLDQTLVISERLSKQLSAHVKWWNEKGHKAKVILPDGLNAVKIMTIHKSKGLEFTNVFIPFLNWELKSTKNYLWAMAPEEFRPLQDTLIPNKSKVLEKIGLDALHKSELSKDKLDQANKLYVALTRASLNLFIYGVDKINKDSVSSHFLQWTAGLPEYNPENQVFEKGNLVPYNPPKQLKNKEVYELLSLTSNPLNKNLQLLSKDIKPDFLEEDARLHGITIHQLLSKINSSSDIEQTLHKEFSNLGIDSSTFRELKKILTEIVDFGEKEGWMGKELTARNEMDILLRKNANNQIIRPDRVIFNTDCTWVIDYKTGKPDPSHQTQVSTYMEALTEMNLPKVKGSIIYINSLTSIHL